VAQANTKKATKLNKAIDAGQSNNANLDTSATYSRSTDEPGNSLGDQIDTMSEPNTSNSNLELLRARYFSFLSDDRPFQDIGMSENSRKLYQIPADQQASLQTETAAEKSVLQAPDVRYRSASLRNPPMTSVEEGLLDEEWWNTVPGVDVWEYPLSFVETPSSDPFT
jgi:hypothetical protein